MLRVDHLLLVVQDRQTDFAFREAFLKVGDALLGSGRSGLRAGRLALQIADPCRESHRLDDNGNYESDRELCISDPVHAKNCIACVVRGSNAGH